MAKKKSVGPTATRKRTPDTASEMRAPASPQDAVYDPSYDEIAGAAYQRFLERGSGHGGDFDDWVEAERALRSRR